MEIYTDGSCSPNPGPGGWAFVVYFDDGTKHSESGAEGYTTNNRMEITALINALYWCLNNYNNKSIVIWCDSEYVVKGYNQWVNAWARNNWKRGKSEVKNKDLWKLVYELKHSFSGKVKWLRGHSEIQGNEDADILANLARENY